MHHVKAFFSARRRYFFVLRDVYSEHVYLQEESLTVVLRLKNRSEFVLIICYLELINSSHADSSMADKTTISFLLEGKHVVNEHHVIRKSHDATHKKNVPTQCITMYHVIGLKQTRGIKNVTLKAAKKFVGVAVYC